MVWAQSSMSVMANSSQSATRASMSAMWPRMWESIRKRAPLSFAFSRRSSTPMW
jgi:hypothetical protein